VRGERHAQDEAADRKEQLDARLGKIGVKRQGWRDGATFQRCVNVEQNYWRDRNETKPINLGDETLLGRDPPQLQQDCLKIGTPSIDLGDEKCNVLDALGVAPR
jgi:hypothetical protein